MVVQSQVKVPKKSIEAGLTKSFNPYHNELQRIRESKIGIGDIDNANMTGPDQAKIIRKTAEGGKRIHVSSIHNQPLRNREGNVGIGDIGNANMVGSGQAKITRKTTEGEKRNHVNSINNEPLGTREGNVGLSDIRNAKMVGQAQDKIVRNNGGGSRIPGNTMQNEPERIGEADIDMDDIGSNTHSPAYEENEYNDPMQPSTNQGGNKRKHASKLASRLQTVLSSHEAASPTHIEVNIAEENQRRKIRTKYLHDNRRIRDGTQENDLNMSSQASATSAKRKKSQRGKYKSLALEKKTMGGQFKLDIEIPDFVLQALGENARLMVNFCGYVVRTSAPMNAEDWSDVSAKYGQSMWLQVKNKFDIKDSCTQLLRLQAFAADVMKRLYRYWKCRLHTYYKECGNTYEERLANRPTDLPAANWRACCDVFNSDKFKQRSERNSQNRKSNKWYKHTTGNLSYAEVEHILTKANDGVLPPANVVWLAEHTHTNGQGVLEWVNDNRSMEIHAQLHQLVQEKDKEPEGDEIRPQTQEEMLLHVLGPRSGYTRGKGNGYGGSIKAKLQQEQQQNIRKQQDQITHLQSELEGSQNQIALLQNELDESKKQIAESKKQMEEFKLQQASTMADMEKRLMQQLKKRSRSEFHDDDSDDE